VVVWVDREGSVTALSEERRNHHHPRLSPHGTHLAITETSASRSDIWLYDIERESRSRLTTEGNINVIPVWAPDGERVAFLSDRAPSPGIYWRSVDGVGDAEPLSLPEPGRVHAPRDWSPDGGVLLFEASGAQYKRRSDLWALHVDGDRMPEPFMATDFDERTPRFSPDGRWVAYISDETGRFEVYVRSYTGPPGKWTISTDGGTEPIWSVDGRELFYRHGDQMMVVDISTDPDFAAGKPRVLFEGRFEVSQLLIQSYDVSRDGSRFVMLQRAEGGHASRINVILNWLDDVTRELR
jgi:serine/threonine-protein kinase